MNSGKIRIYDLARELNLDNKDILVLCEQLDISAKSHSSTIADVDAERLRAAAEKYTSQPAVSARATTNRQASTQATVEVKSKAPVSLQKKQQILEIRKPTNQPIEAPEPPTPPNPPAQPSPAVGNEAPVKEKEKPAVAITKPASPNRPVRPTDRDADPVVEPAPVLEKPSPEPVEVAPPPIPMAKEDFAEHQVTENIEEVTEEVEPLPELASPPPRPSYSAQGSTETSPKPSLSGRLVKRSATEQPVKASAVPAPTKPDADNSAPARPRSVQPPVKSGGSNRPAGVTKAPEKKPVRPQQTIVELRRPSPTRPAEAEPVVEPPIKRQVGSDELVRPVLRMPNKAPTDSSTASVVPDPNSVLEAQLRERPSLARSSKKTKEWEDEEEGREGSKAIGKVGTKSKRRNQPNLDEEEEDLDFGLDSEDSSDVTQVSLSLMRPAKPKGTRPAVPKPSAASPQRVAKKSSSPRDRRERREAEAQQEKPEKITLLGGVTVQELADLMVVPVTDVIRTLFMKGVMATVTQTLDIPTITMVAEEMGIQVETEEAKSEARKLTEMLDAEDLEHLSRRPPVVTIMGHVDHGKTTLLDSIRNAKVAQGEAGGITQHIGAYHVDVEHNEEVQQVVFLDTPGHEAFTAMRARGARVTDIAVLVVAADDGVRPQTIEAISHAKAAEVPIVVAINKIDKEDSQPDRVKQELTEYGLVPEEWGGETIMVPVSALTGTNLDTLLEMLLLVAEVEDLYANPDRLARGTVIEAHLDKAKGPVATLLIQNGTLKVGDVLVAGSVFGKVRAMMDDRGKRVNIASPSFAVEVLGLNDVPAAGDEFQIYADEREARAIASKRSDEQRQSRLVQAMGSRRVSLNMLSAQAQEGELKELNLILKADVQGSLEAILSSLQQLPQKEVQVRVLYAAPGEVTETDVDLASASSAVIVGFNTTLASGARQAADQAGVDVREYDIIYRLLDDIRGAMEGLLEPEMVEEHLGQVEVRAVFPVGRGSVAGCYVQSGKVIRNCKVRILRNREVIYEGNLDSLKRMKEDAKEVNAGYECGIGLDSFSQWEVGDIIEAYRMVSKRRTLSA
jgi:translation initiation factor IF-2